jgi:hypothetical protein
MPKGYSLLIAVVGMLSTSTIATAGSPEKGKCMAALPKPTGAPADTPAPKPPNRVVLFDASPTQADIANANRIFVLDACNDSAIVRDLWARLKAQFDTTGKPDTVQAAALKTFLLKNAGRLAKFSSLRWISRKGDQADVYVLHLTTSARTIDFNEVPRKTRFDTDIGTLAQLAAAIVGAAPGTKAQVTNAPGYITTART